MDPPGLPGFLFGVMEGQLGNGTDLVGQVDVGVDAGESWIPMKKGNTSLRNLNVKYREPTTHDVYDSIKA